jgi:tetratricopeptide (TPR) repeat protein
MRFEAQLIRLAPLLVSLLFAAAVCAPAIQAQLAHDSTDPLAGALEAARRTENETQLQAVKARIEQRIADDAANSLNYYLLAQVQGYFADVYESRKDKKNASAAVDRGIEAVQHAIQLNDKSADAHSLLADLYGRKISLGGMLAGPKFGPKIDEENKKAMALDDKSPRVWASQGRKYLMAPKMFGGDAGKAVESFQKSLAVDAGQDETWVWLAKAFQKAGDKKKAQEALQKALQLNPDSHFAKITTKELSE